MHYFASLRAPRGSASLKPPPLHRALSSTALLSFITLSLTAIIIFSVYVTDHCVALPRKWCPVGTGPCPVPEPCQTCLETPREKSESHHRAECSCVYLCALPRAY